MGNKTRQAASMYKAYVQKGGWEGWAQVEFTTEFNDFMDQLQGYGLDIAADVQREACVYTSDPRLKTDLLIHTYYNATPEIQRLVGYPGLKELQELPRQSFIIELKCESLKNNQNFSRNVIEDLQKIRTPTNVEDHPTNVSVEKLVLAISVSPEGYQAMEKIANDAQSKIATKTIYLGRTEHNYTIFLWMFCWGQFQDISLITVDIEGHILNKFMRITAQEWTTSFIRRLPQALKAREIPLQKYYLWHHLHQDLSTVVCIFHDVQNYTTYQRKHPFEWSRLTCCVADDIMQSVKLENLPFDRDRIRKLILINEGLAPYRRIFQIYD